MSEHPITPPPELVMQWYDASRGPRFEHELATQAARWGWQQRDASVADELQKARDEELEACCELLDINGCSSKWIDMLRTARRPKPPSLAEQALALINHDPANQPFLSEKGIATIRCALERLQELEKGDE